MAKSRCLEVLVKFTLGGSMAENAVALVRIGEF